MTEEYVDTEFPEMENQHEEILESEEHPESEEHTETEVLHEEFYEENPVSGEFVEQEVLELVEPSSDIQEVFSVPEYPPREAPKSMTQDSGGALFLPGDDPLQQPLMSNPLDPRLVYTRSVSKRLRHLTCERQGAEYLRPAGLYRPGG